MTRRDLRHPLRRFAAVAALSLLAATGATAQERHTAIAAGDVSFAPGPATLPEGAEIAVLLGNPGEEGAYVLRVRFPAGYAVPPHTHPKDETITVVSGALGIATGEALDRGAAAPLPQGSFVNIPVGQAHYAWTEEETVVQLHGMGPYGIEYLDAGDDPRIN